jgi:predicted porin
MKRSFIALAICCSVVSAAHAQEDEGESAGGETASQAVRIYGGADIGLVYNKGGSAGGSVVGLDSGLIYGSRLGFKGAENLGNGLSAHFLLENGFAVDTGQFTQGGLLWGRQAFVGLKSRAGTVNFGRQYTPLFWATNKVDPFPGSGSAGDILRIFSSGGTRINNSVTYASPTIAHLSTELLYGLGEVPGNNSGSRQFGLRVEYINRPVVVSFAHHNSNDATGTISRKTTFLGGAYDFRVVKASIAYAVNKDGALLDTRDFLLGAVVPLGPHRLMGSYMRKRDELAANADATQYAAGYIYSLSKRTRLYTIYSVINNDSNANYNVATRGTTGRLLNMGIAHTF